MRYLVAGIIGLGLLFTTSVQGASAFVWPASPSVTQSVADPDDGLAKTARDILSADYAYDSGFHYFRITLKGAPSGVGPSDNWAGNYGIYINSGPGGWDYQDTTYLPYPIQGVDTSSINIALDGHWNFAGGGASFATIGQHNHVANATPGAYDYATLDGFNPQPPTSSNVIEFKLSDSYLSGPFSFFAGTLDMGSEFGTYDLTANTYVPEPATLTALVVGSLALLRRRR